MLDGVRAMWSNVYSSRKQATQTRHNTELHLTRSSSKGRVGQAGSRAEDESDWGNLTYIYI